MAHEAIARTRRAASEAKKVLPRVPALLSAIQQEQAGYPTKGTGSWNPSGSSTVLYCEDHECELSDCHAKDRSCSGVPVSTHSDSTGDAAIEPSKAREDEQRLTAAAKNLERAVLDLGDLVTAYLEAKSLGSRDLAHLHSQTSDPGCRSCARIKRDGRRHYTPAARTRSGRILFSDGSTSRWRTATMPDGSIRRIRPNPQSVLAEEWPLCRWCCDVLETTRNLPPRDMLRDHQDGKRTKPKRGWQRPQEAAVG